MTIKEMLISGKSADDLYNEIARAQTEIEQEKKKNEAEAAKRAKVEEARKKVVEAMKEYNKALYGTEADVQIMDNFNTDLKEIERKAREIEKSIYSDDERIKKFLRGII